MDNSEIVGLDPITRPVNNPINIFKINPNIVKINPNIVLYYDFSLNIYGYR